MSDDVKGIRYLVRHGTLTARSCVGCRRRVLGFAFVSHPCFACVVLARSGHLPMAVVADAVDEASSFDADRESTRGSEVRDGRP